MAELLADVADLVWSYPVVGLCLLSALFFTLRLGCVQLRAFPHALALLTGRYDREDEAGNISHFQALAAALSGTIGIGNIAGVAIAIAVGGPGAVLWMWITGLLGMATKFVECTLGTHYRKVDPISGEARGGPMVYILEGLGPRWRPVALFYALTIAFAGFGFTCMFQSNQAADALRSNFAVPTWISGLALAALTGAVIIGGIRSIGRWAARLVPAMCLIYLGGALLICVLHIDLLPAVAAVIVRDGLSGEAAAGGALGSVILWGVRRAIFSNEAGLGSASIAHAAVKTDEPVREGVVASLGPFIDTVIVSGATAFVIVLAGNYGALDGGALAELDAVEQRAGGWRPATLDEAPADDEPTRRFVDGAPLWALQAVDEDGDAAGSLRFSLPAQLDEVDGLRVPFALERGSVHARLQVDGAPLDDPNLELELEAGPAWQARTLALDEDQRERLAGASVELTLTPGPEARGAFVAAPSLVEARSGISLSAASFDEFIPGFGSIFISIAGFAFALSTMVTWSYYGEVASVWVFGDRAGVPYRLAFVALAFVGAVYKLELVISISDIFVGLLVVPNVIALLWLSPKVAGWSRDYFARLRAGEFDRQPGE